MAGLVAVVAAPRSSAVEAHEVTDLLAAYRHFRPATTAPATVGDDRVLCVLETGQSTMLSRDVGSWLASTGPMYPTTPWSHPYASHVEHVDGQFAAVGYDAEQDTVVVVNDPMGMCALYVAERPGRLYVSTSALALARHLSPQASRLCVQEFLLAGYHFGSRTHWDDVRRLDPGTCITVRQDRMEERTYWRPTIDTSVRSLTLEQASDHHIEVARSTYTGYLGAEETWADLTGGYDSRLLCLLLEDAGVHFATNTRSAPSPDDVEIARELAALRGWTWLDCQLPPDWPLLLPGLLDDALAWGDGRLEVLQLARVLHPHRRLAELGPRRMVSGGGGEHLQYHAWQSEFLNAGRSTTFNMGRWIDMIALKPTDPSVLAGDPRPDVREGFAARVSRWIEPYAGEPNTTQLDVAYAYRHTGHFGAYRSVDDGEFRAELPFYYKPIISAAISTAHRHRNGHRLMRRMMEKLDAEVAAVRTTRGGPALPWRPTRAHRYLPYIGVVGRKGINKVSQRALGRTLLARNLGFGWQAAANGAVLAAIGSGGATDPNQMRIEPLLEPARFRSFLAESLRPGFAHSAMLGRIITAEMALRATDTTLE